MTGLGSSCGACKFLRRKCAAGCVFAPYFSYDEAPSHFAAVHKVFGASNVSKLLLHLPLQNRSDAAITISYEALARMRDPVYGCVAHIFALQQEVLKLQEEIELLENHMAYPAVFGNQANYESDHHQATGNRFNTGLQSSVQQDSTNTGNYDQNHQLLDPLLLHNLEFNNQMDQVKASPLFYGLEDQDHLFREFNPNQNPGSGQESFACYPW